jgi:hypothetical protein
MSTTPITWKFTEVPSAAAFGPQANNTQLDIGLNTATAQLYGGLSASIPISMSVKTWSPRDIATPILWLDAADFGTFSFSSGTNINTWANKGSTSTTNATAGTVKPVYNATGFNNLPTVQFTGATAATDSSWFQGTMSGAAINTGSFVHAFIVCSITNQAGNPTQYARLLSLARNGISDVARTDTTLAFGRNLSLNPIYVNRNTADVLLSSSFGTPLLAESYSEPNTTYMAINGSPIPPSSAASGTALAFNIDRYGIGIAAGYPLTVETFTLFTGSISEVIYYKDQLSLSQICTMEGYLAWKWGLQANLPNIHPFKNFPPPPS